MDETEFQNGQNFPKFKSFQDLLAKSPRSQWEIGNLCEFVCRFCQKVYQSHSGIFRHAKATGHLKDNKSSIVLKSISKSVVHRCKACGTLLLCDASYLNTHIRKVHKMSVAEYCKTNRCALKLQRNGVKNLVTDKASITTSSPNSVGNLCSFSCHLCSKTFGRITSIKSHMLKVHSMDFNRKQIKCNLLKKIVTHRCLLCGKELLCESAYLSSHFNNQHKINSIFDYCKITGCKTDITHTYETAMKSLPKPPGVTTEIGNLCQWLCKICSKLFECRRVLREHLHKDHYNFDKIDYSALLPQVVLHQCHYCPKKVLCELKILSNHYERAHGALGLTFYKRKMAELRGTKDNKSQSVEDTSEETRRGQKQTGPVKRFPNRKIPFTTPTNDVAFGSNPVSGTGKKAVQAKGNRNEKKIMIKPCRVVLHDIFNSSADDDFD